MLRLPLLRYFLIAFIPLLAACHRPLYISRQDAQVYPIQASDRSDSSMMKMLLPYREKMEAEVSIVIGCAGAAFTKAQPECSMGNLLADAQLYAARSVDKDVAVSVVNYGGIRLQSLDSGAIKLERIYELMPFDNQLVILQIPGKMLGSFCGHMALMGGWPVSGITYIIKNKEATNITVNGMEVDSNKLYKVALSDYIATGGDNCSFLKPFTMTPVNMYIREALIAYIREQPAQRVYPRLEGRVSYAR